MRHNRKVFEKGDVALVRCDGFYFAGRFSHYKSNDTAYITFPMYSSFKRNTGTLLCKKAKNNVHWNIVKY